MKAIHLLGFVILATYGAFSFAADGMTALKSPYSAKETMNRLEDAVHKNKLIVFARIDHAAGAAEVGKTLRPTELLVFGHPRGGTPFMECAQTAGIDLPLKALVWEDASAQVWIGYNDLSFLAKRHGVTQCSATEKLNQALANLTATAIAQ